MSDKEEKGQAKLAQDIKAVTDNWVAQVELQNTLAKMAMEKFRALKMAGFTERQAIELCKY